MKTILLFSYYLLVTMVSYAQDVKTICKKPVTLELKNGALHCPHLLPRFKTTFGSLSWVENVQLNTARDVATFFITDVRVNEDSIKKYVYEVGCPISEIKRLEIGKNEMPSKNTKK